MMTSAIKEATDLNFEPPSGNQTQDGADLPEISSEEVARISTKMGEALQKSKAFLLDAIRQMESFDN